MFRMLFGALISITLIGSTEAEISPILLPPEFETHRESSSDPNLEDNIDWRTIEPGETLILGELRGPGIINHIWTTTRSDDPFFARSLVIRIYWDGAERPSVVSPLGDFFGVGHAAQADFSSIPVATSSFGRSRNCYWEMPFRESARVTVTNESDRYLTQLFYFYLDWQKVESLPEDVLYFHAKYHQEFPAKPGPYTILEATGTGKYLGTVYSAQQVETGWFGEGDDRFYIDGEEKPRLVGTGTEDYFGDAWGFRKFSRPYHGVSLWEGYFPGDRNTAYRWHLRDPIAFSKSLRFEIEHKGSVFTDDWEVVEGFIDRPDWISSVAFWCQTPPVGLESNLPPASERIAPYRILMASETVIAATPAGAMAITPTSVSFSPGDEDGEIVFDFELDEPGRYQINVYISHSIFGGVYQTFLNGHRLGEPLDLWHSGNDPVWTCFDLHDFKAGVHRLAFKTLAPSPNRRTLAPKRGTFEISHLILLRMEDMAGYHRIHDTKSD